MDLTTFIEILKQVRNFVKNSQFHYKDEVLKILDGLDWAMAFLIKSNLISILIDALKNLKENGDNTDDNKMMSNLNKLGSLDLNDEQPSSSSSTVKDFVIKSILRVGPYMSQLIKFVHLVYCECCKKPGMLECVANHQKMSYTIVAIQSVGYILNFAVLAWGFYAVCSARKSNLTETKKRKLEEKIVAIEKRINDANSEFDKENWKEFEFIHEDIRDKIDDFRDEINKLEFEINGTICSLRIAKASGMHVAISSVLSGAINVLEIMRNPTSLIPKVFLGLDIALGVGGLVTFKLSMDSINDLKKSLEELEIFREKMIELREGHKEKYNEYLKKQQGPPIPKIKSLSPKEELNNEKKAKEILKFDQKKPETDIKIKLMDGSSILVHANESHKISDLRTYIINVNPDYGNYAFVLNKSPNEQLLNENLTLAEADVLDSNLFQYPK